MGIALYLVGAPGIGKTTLARNLLGIGPHGELPLGGYLIAKPKWTVTPKACAGGHYTGGTFDGADMVPAPAYKEALLYWAKDLAPAKRLTLLDGDRFSMPNALAIVREHAHVVVAHLTAPDEVHAARRAARGSKQDPTWAKGRVTKAANFVEHAKKLGHLIVTLNAGAMTADQMRLVLGAVPGLAETFA